MDYIQNLLNRDKLIRHVLTREERQAIEKIKRNYEKSDMKRFELELENRDKDLIIKKAINHIAENYDFDGDTKAPYPTETEYKLLKILKGE